MDLYSLENIQTSRQTWGSVARVSRSPRICSRSFDRPYTRNSTPTNASE